MHNYILRSLINRDVALLHASTECFNDVSSVVDEDCRMAPMSKHLVFAPIAERLAKTNIFLKSRGMCQDEIAGERHRSD